MTVAIEPGQLWLGACVGGQLLVVILCVVEGNAYRERPLLLHAAATLMGVFTLQALMGDQPWQPRVVFLLLPALAGLQLLDLVTHAGALRRARRWLLGTSAIALPLLAAASFYTAWFFVAAMLLWGAVVASLLALAWRQSKPWVWWMPVALVALMAASIDIVIHRGPGNLEDALVLGGLLTLWSACTYLATGWRGRLHGETRARVHARNTIDPLTGLATPLVLAERLQAARHMTRRYGHPSVLMVVHIENLHGLAHEFGLEVAESAVLAAASRIRDSLMRDGDVAARLSHARIGVLAEGAAAGPAAAAIAQRILVAGLKEPLAAAPGEVLRFRIVLTAVPTEEVPPKVLIQRLSARMDEEVRGASERRILTVTTDDLLVETEDSTL